MLPFCRKPLRKNRKKGLPVRFVVGRGRPSSTAAAERAPDATAWPRRAAATSRRRLDDPGGAIGAAPAGGAASLRTIAPYSYSPIGRRARAARLAGAVPRAKASLDELGHWRVNVSRGESLAFALDA